MAIKTLLSGKPRKLNLLAGIEDDDPMDSMADWATEPAVKHNLTHNLRAEEPKKPPPATQPKPSDPTITGDELPAIHLNRVPPDEVKLWNRLKNPAAFSEAALDRKLMIAYMKTLWKKANHMFFNNELLPCTFTLGKDTGAWFKNRGMWRPAKRTLQISVRLFNGLEAYAVSTIVHEMCHQAVTDISKVAGGTEKVRKGHGPIWEDWMRKCDLVPRQYDMTSNREYMKPKDASKVMKSDLIRTDIEKRGGGTPIQFVHSGDLIQFYAPGFTKMTPGVVAFQETKKWGRWYVMYRGPDSLAYFVLPVSYMHTLNPKDTTTKEMLEKWRERIAEWSVRVKDGEKKKKDYDTGIVKKAKKQGLT